MGKLGPQPARDQQRVSVEQASDLLEDCLALSKKYKVEVRDALQAFAVLEQRRQNILYVNNGDNTDEQTGGFGDLFSEFNRQLENISEALNKIAEKE